MTPNTKTHLMNSLTKKTKNNKMKKVQTTTTKTMYDQVMSSLVGLRTRHTYNLEELKALQFTESAIQWDAHELIKKTTIVSTVDGIITRFGEIDKDAWEDFVYKTMRGLVSSMRYCTHNSTNIYANAVALSKKEAYGEMVDALLPYLEPDTL